jgi:type IV pilus assembly protein PilN
VIKINLMPVRESRANTDAVIQIVAMAVIVVAALAVVFVVNSVKEDEIAALTARVAQTNEEIQRLDKIIGEVNKFTSTKKALEAKLNVINELRAKRLGPVQAMDDLSQRIPSKVWVTKFAEVEQQVSLEGVAETEEDVALFLAELERSQYFSDVQLGVIEKSEKEQNRNRFTLNCKVKYALR